MSAHQLDTTSFSDISNVARTNASVLDEIDTPRLLHGDLWTFNLIVRRDGDKPVIAGVLDVDRAWWGDPMADWMMFLLNIRQDDPEWQQRLSAFYGGYGPPTSTSETRFRQQIYTAMCTGSAAIWSFKNKSEKGIARAYRLLDEIAQSLL